MISDHDKKLARLRHEKSLMLQDMARPGFQIIMTKLNQAVDKMEADFWKQGNCSLYSDAGVRAGQYVQVWHDIVKVEIPKLLELSMNVDEEERWTFAGWLAGIQDCIKGFICNEWLKKHMSKFTH